MHALTEQKVYAAGTSGQSGADGGGGGAGTPGVEGGAHGGEDVTAISPTKIVVR